MKRLQVLIKPASSLCNLRCRYCFYADVSSLREVSSYGLMSRETAEKLIASVYKDLQDGDTIDFAFQGGEPTLAGLHYFGHFVETIGRQTVWAKVNYSLQTNGILLNESWCAFLKEHNVLVGLSLDGPTAFHNSNRLDPQGKGTFSRIQKAKAMLERFKVDYNILCVLTRSLARHPQKIWQFLLNENIRYIQFIPCLSSVGGCTEDPNALTPERFASFYKQLFPLWLEEFRKGNYISIKLFDDVVNLLAQGIATACGLMGQCQPQYVIEADGSVYPCDFYVLDEYRLGMIQTHPLSAMFRSPVMQRFLHTRQIPAGCCDCNYLQICRGGCKRMEREICAGQGAECGYKEFLNSHMAELQEVARIQKRK